MKAFVVVTDNGKGVATRGILAWSNDGWTAFRREPSVVHIRRHEDRADFVEGGMVVGDIGAQPIIAPNVVLRAVLARSIVKRLSGVFES